MMRGIFFCASSLMAIWSGSVSPSGGTRTGAFILYRGMNKQTRFSTNYCNVTRKEKMTERIGVETHLICSARVPNTLARSYLVMYGVVTRSEFGCFAALSVWPGA